jgi:hypothetical protein
MRIFLLKPAFARQSLSARFRNRIPLALLLVRVQDLAR